MLRTQIQLSGEQQAKLKALAARRGTSLAGLIREGVDLLLQRAEGQERWKRLWMAVGSCHESDHADDVAERHDAYLLDTYRADNGLR